ncbi:MAG: DUF397 domain-containing protein [Actinoallomurus sp.]
MIWQKSSHSSNGEGSCVEVAVKESEK